MLIFGVLPFGATAQTFSTLGITSTTPTQETIIILEKDLLSLYQKLSVLLAEQNQLENAQITQANQIQSLRQSSTQPLALSGASTTIPSRSYRVIEEAKVNFGNGFVRGADIQTIPPKLSPNQIVTGELVFTCIYNSHVNGLPDFCDNTSAIDTSSLPQISNTSLTISFDDQYLTCKSGVPMVQSSQKTEFLTTNVSGDFSFTIPSSTDMTNYKVSISNGGIAVLSFYATNSAIPDVSTFCN